MKKGYLKNKIQYIEATKAFGRNNSKAFLRSKLIISKCLFLYAEADSYKKKKT